MQARPSDINDNASPRPKLARPLRIAIIILDRLLLLAWPAVLAWSLWWTGLAGGHGAIHIGGIAEGWKEVAEGDAPWLLLLVFVPVSGCLTAWGLMLFAKTDLVRNLALAVLLSTFAATFLWLLYLSEGADFTLLTGKRLVIAACIAAAHLAARQFSGSRARARESHCTINPSD